MVWVRKLLGLNFDPNPNCNFALTLIMTIPYLHRVTTGANRGGPGGPRRTVCPPGVDSSFFSIPV